MKKRQYFSLLATVLISMNACESNDLPVQYADSYDYITFAAKMQKEITRAREYEGYDANKHPQTMGAFGYNNLPSHDFSSTEGEIFKNETVTYDKASNCWKTKPEKKWDDYKNRNFDFFGYMPWNAQATLTKSSTSESTYVLSIPYTIPTINDKPSPILFEKDLKQAPLICAFPEHKIGTTAEGKEQTFERVVELKFDQTLTGYYLNFQLDTRMNKLRYFRIKGVKIGGKLPTAGNVTRTYKFNGSNWTAEDIKWTNLQISEWDDQNANNVNNGIKLAKDPTTTDPASPTADEYMELKDDQYHRWGTTFYAIADASFVPIIAVTYDVILKDEKGETVTRKDVTSTITLGKAFFESLDPGKTATIYPINIFIQPRYLYVLADQDAYTGHLLIQ